MNSIAEPVSIGVSDTVSRPPRLKVLCLYPAFDPAINEMAIAWKALADAGDVSCRVICGSRDELKGLDNATLSVDDGLLSIRRVPGSLHQHAGSAAMVEWAVQFKPDVIFCANQDNVRLGNLLRRHCGAPVVVHTEYWFEDKWRRRREFLGLTALRPLAGRLLRWRVARAVDKVLISNPAELDRIQADPRGRLAYLPWPHPPGSGATVLPRERRDCNEVLYIGSISVWKGVATLERYFSELLRSDPAIKVHMIGPPIDPQSVDALARLAALGGARFRHTAGQPRAQALQTIGQVLCVFTSGTLFGWGSIGDAFGRGTPVIGILEQYEMRHGQTALIAGNPADFVDHVRTLRDDPAIWNRLSARGAECVGVEHSVAAVGRSMMKSMRSVIHQPAA